MNRLKASIFVYLIRPLLKNAESGDVMDCPVCGELLQFYERDGWLHLADGDADCYGALGYGKGP